MGLGYTHGRGQEQVVADGLHDEAHVPGSTHAQCSDVRGALCTECAGICALNAPGGLCALNALGSVHCACVWRPVADPKKAVSTTKPVRKRIGEKEYTKPVPSSRMVTPCRCCITLWYAPPSSIGHVA